MYMSLLPAVLMMLLAFADKSRPAGEKSPKASQHPVSV
jgi:hypothetical protein